MRNLLILSLIALISLSCSSVNDDVTDSDDNYNTSNGSSITDFDRNSICGNLIEEPGEECDSDLDTCSECKYPRMIYVNTTRSFTAIDIGSTSLEKLNDICELSAIENGFHTSKSWKAWISKIDDDVKDRIFQSPGLYVNYVGDVIAYSFTDLTDGTINTPILLDQSGVSNKVEVWTGTFTDGTASNANCDNWSLSSGFFGTYGKTDSILKDWTSSYNWADCADSKYIYCIESEYLP
jgi:hypothetical protein